MTDDIQPHHIADDTLAGLVGYRLRRASNAIQGDLSETLKPFELRMITFTALVLIRDNAGLSQSRLAAAMDVERPNLVVIVDELENRDLITRERVPTDRRTYALNTTPAGETLCAEALEAVKAHEVRMLAGVEDGTQVVLVAALARIIGNRRGGDE